MRAVVMAGGEGSRLRPITSNRPKPLAPVCNRPIMAHIVDLLKHHGFDEIATTLHYLAHEIQNYFGDGSEFGVSMTHFIEDSPLGTAGSVKQAEAMLQGESFVIISGDALTDIDLTKAMAWHKAKGSLATIVLARVPNPLEFGIVITDEEGRIQRFLEKPGWGEVFSDTVNTGIYILEPEIFKLIESNAVVDWSKDVFPELLRTNAPLFGYIMNEYWSDIGTLEQYREAQEHVLQGRTKIAIPGKEHSPGVWVGEGTVIESDVQLNAPICIGSNCRIKRGSSIGPFTVIGDSTLVEEGSSIDRSVLWERCYVGLDCRIRGAVLGQQVTTKRDVQVQDDAVVGDRCLLDVGCIIRPRVKIWPYKTIERGATLTVSLVSGDRWRNTLFRDLGVAGISNIEITPEFSTRFAMAFGSTLRPGSRIVASRDSARSSRMIKRSVMASLLSAGCHVIDLHGAPMPVLRHFVRATGADGAINVRKQPGNARMSLIELLDGGGGYLSRTNERKIESTFFREDFRRAPTDELLQIEDALQAVESYTRDFKASTIPTSHPVRPKVVIDYGFSSVSPIFPALLHQLNIEKISINSFNDARSAPRNHEAVREHLANLGRIVSSVGYDMGILVTNEGENLYVVDESGVPIVSTTLLAALGTLIAESKPGAKIALSVTAPERLVSLLESKGAVISRCRSGVRDLMSASIGLDFAGDENGGFIFPAFHPGFDAMFAMVTLARLVKSSGQTLGQLVNQLPEFFISTGRVTCPWETKGTVMRRLVEQPGDRRIELVDGVKLYDEKSWVLILPDAFEPVFHVVAESPTPAESQTLVHDTIERINTLQSGR